jgi:hypothetical protein
MAFLIDIGAIVYIFAAFIWSTTDVYKRSIKSGKPMYDWFLIFVFLFDFLFMPVLAAIEKVLDSDDYYQAIVKAFKD